MTILLLCHLALAHGGEDHAEAAPAALAPDPDALRVPLASATFEAVVRLGDAHPGEPVGTRLLLADFATSAPVDDATAKLTLSGPGSVDLAFTHGGPGIYDATATFPAAGTYAGALVVTTPGTSDILSVSGLVVGAHTEDVAATALGWAGVCTTLALVVGAGTLMAIVGYAVGRRRGMAAAAALALAASADRVQAHGGEDHGAPAAAAAPTGAGLALPLESQFLLELRTQPVVSGPFREQVQAAGVLVARPGESATLRAPVAGVLVAPPGGFPAPGARVEAGQLLAQIREIPGQAERVALGQARSEAGTRVAELRAALALAERDAATAETLGDAISDRERLARREAVVAAREALRQAGRAEAAAGSGTAVDIRAPLAGTLGAITARPGDQLEAGTSLFLVTDVTGLWVEARVPERLALGLVAGAPASVTTDASPDRVLSATVLDAGLQADPETGAVLVTLALDAPEADLLPGFGARAWIGRGEARDVVTLPNAAIVNSNGASLAFVKTGPETFAMRELRLGARAGGAVEVLAGVAPGERVVTRGTYALRSLAGR